MLAAKCHYCSTVQSYCGVFWSRVKHCICEAKQIDPPIGPSESRHAMCDV